MRSPLSYNSPLQESLFCRNLGSSLALLAALCACTPTKIAPPPVVGLDATYCDAQPNLAMARSLPYPGKDTKPVTVELGYSAPCINEAGASYVYAVFALPATETPYIISVRSIPLAPSLFAPRLRLVDSTGATKRDVPSSSFLFRGTDLSVELRSHSDESYLLVMSDPELVGRKISRVKTGTEVSTFGAGLVYFNVYSGVDQTNQLTFSHNGRIEVEIRAAPS